MKEEYSYTTGEKRPLTKNIAIINCSDHRKPTNEILLSWQRSYKQDIRKGPGKGGIKREQTSSILFECVPDIAVEIIVSTEKEASALTKGDAGDTADDVVVREHAHLLIGANIEEATGGVVTACAEGEAGGEEGDGIYIRLVTRERLLALTVPYVPQLHPSTNGETQAVPVSIYFRQIL